MCEVFYTYIDFNVSKVIWGLHVPFVETNSFNERKLINDLKKGKVKIAIACEFNNYCNTRFDHWLLKLKHNFKVRWLANFLARTINRHIIIPRHLKRLENITNKNHLDYFLHFDSDASKYRGLIDDTIKEFTLVIFTARDLWDGKVYCLPTSLTYKMNEKGEFSGADSDPRSTLYFPPTSFLTENLIFGTPWGKIKRLERMESQGC